MCLNVLSLSREGVDFELRLGQELLEGMYQIQEVSKCRDLEGPTAVHCQRAMTKVATAKTWVGRPGGAQLALCPPKRS